jgi:hypothetical protein
MTILSFRIASVKEERESKAFRNPSHNSDTKIFAQIFSLPHLSNSAACFAAKACKAHRSYEVIPDADERRFFAAAVFSLIAVSILLTLIGLHVINPGWLPILKSINTHMNALFGGIVTISLAAIGLISKPIMNRTRFWFMIPILISATVFPRNSECLT